MPRFLTPARLCVLVLIELYHSGKSSLESSLDVLEFIARHVSDLPESRSLGSGRSDSLLLLDMHDFSEALQKCSSYVPGRNMNDIFLQSIWELQGLDAFPDLLHRVYSLIYHPGSDPLPEGRPYSPTSPLGQFIRRCYVEFTRLQFADLQALWGTFTTFRSPSFDGWSAKNPELARQYSENDLSDGLQSLVRRHPVGASTGNGFGSAADADAILGSAIKSLQKLGARVPKEIRAQLEKWIGEESDSSSHSLHFFMAFFDNWRAGQYTMALDSLHRYFDYSLAAKSGSANMRMYYQYALLHLSVLHADFECWEESVDAMNECIATARENQDADCLNYALSWLLYLRHAHPVKGKAAFGTVFGIVGNNGGELDEVAFLKAKAREGKHWLLLCSTLLEEAKLEMYNGGSAGRAQERILQAMYLNIQYDLRSLAHAASTFHAASYERAGQTHLGNRLFEMAATVHDPHCPLNDSVRAVCRLAYRLYQRGFASKGLQMLRDFSRRAKGVLKLEQKVNAFLGLIQVKVYLHRGEFEAARYCLAQLQPLQSFSEPDLVFELQNLEIELLVRTDSLEEALKVLSLRLSEMKERKYDVAQRLHFLLMKSKIFAAGGQASKGFSLTLRTITTAERLLLLPLFIDGLVVLSGILIELSSFAAARDILEAAIPHALGFQDLQLIARAFVALGEANVGLVGECGESKPSERLRYVRKAESLIERGRQAYFHMEDSDGMLDCLVMKSRLASWAGDDASANQADELYMEILDRRERV